MQGLKHELQQIQVKHLALCIDRTGSSNLKSRL